MDIGIVTCWKPDDNYGTQIQCYALQTYLRCKGHNTFLIKYHRELDQIRIPLSKRKIRNIINPVKIIKVLYVKLLSLRLKNQESMHNRNSPEFREKYLKQSIDYLSFNALERNPPDADIYIVGSDQVWNINYRQTNNLRAHYLDFGPKNVKRLSYAASFGFAIERLSTEYIDAVFPLLSKFDGISVREKGAIEICNRIGVEGSVQVCDPTLLIEPKKYLEFFKNENIVLPRKKYVFVYNLSATSELDIQEIKRRATEQDYELVYVTGHGKSDHVDKAYPSVPEWVYLIANAETVITNSFHGAIFSLMFHRKLAIYPITGSLFGNPNDRFKTLNALAGKDLLVSGANSLETVLHNNVNWDEFEKRKAELVAVGGSFLNQHIN